MTGCGSDASETDSPDERIGIIAKLNASEEAFNEQMKKLEESARRKGISLAHNHIYFNGLNEMQMALDAGQIDEISTYHCVANYMTARNPQLKILDHTNDMFDSFCCAMRTEDKALRDEFNSAIQSMKSDGTLENLVKTYITDLTGTEDPPAVALETFDGAETIKVGVTGDLPPLDLIRADGTPAGFNTAMISEIGRRTGKNIELVQIDSNARAAALTSEQIDVVFWVTVPDDENLDKNFDKSDSMDTTSPYYRDEIVHVDLKK
ncbi:MAG: transporter substrate-binding domain-containing protein [Selenomonadaceae bacterium]|nr:transporter substrate-binding domain-containing protein [Selenomonadaceae bacterium]